MVPNVSRLLFRTLDETGEIVSSICEEIDLNIQLVDPDVDTGKIQKMVRFLVHQMLVVISYCSENIVFSCQNDREFFNV